MARFEGKIMTPSEAWKVANSCVVRSATLMDCYRSNTEANAAVGWDPTPTFGTSQNLGLDDRASRWPCLFEHENGGGKRLIFNEEKWHHPGNREFDNTVSSWNNNQFWCDDTGILKDGQAFEFQLDGCARASPMGHFDDEALYMHG
ncbi:hypothetical protein LX15_004864 [Streptoalloteichus tenebrarius]|uniref:Uncharacterized protein n=1 Tax=Streptoalloteichus tenebrarius (strain ATCC 17920 / DSM 40477 / JCM 4838 / CBS 697.72 / NBRC 16177 / NCIMB 11028 / NRRL B-12390 / A12253. 1 / ISP 5477) TaxID=1933 RepID=A0ABT1I059_STRSD|nr:hypothetical protein [Streptoalloteichus tenebrarius]MCP2261144.1 hypothetical protein [Streptoalloteichus tenebrarius]